MPAAACAGGRSLIDPVLSPDGASVAFVARGPEGARLVVVPTAGGAENEPAAVPEPAGRGGVVAWLGHGRLAYATNDGVAMVELAGGTVRMVAEGIEGGAGALAGSRGGDGLAWVADTRAVTVVPSDGGGPHPVSDDADFALDPCWSPDGQCLAWHEWDVPAMPWDSSRIVVARAVADGGRERVVVAGGPGVSVQEPRFSPDGTALAFLSDVTGWCNLWVVPAPSGSGSGREASLPSKYVTETVTYLLQSGPTRPLVEEEREHGGPAWGPGARSFAWSPDSRSIAFCRNEGGFGRLCVVDVASGRVRELSPGIHTSLSWAGRYIACVRSGARTPTSVVVVDPVSGVVRVLATGPESTISAIAKALPEPEVVSWEADDGAVVHGRLWRPPAYRGGAPPPLLVWAHGGPTDQRRVSFDTRLVFFLSRGWAVLHPDPRGSTGWGRVWAQELAGRWGEVDVADVAAGARAAVASGWADPSRLVAMGGSAGGMTALLLVARSPELWAAAVALYPVADLEGLASATHRYEAHYPLGLLGALPEHAELYRSRSPLSAAGHITAPVLLLHGSADVVVPARQSRELAALLRARDVPVEHHEYEGEGHGWRAARTVEDELERTDAFLARHVPRRGDRMGR